MSIFDFQAKDLSPLGISYKRIASGHTDDFHFIGDSNNPRLMPDERGFHQHKHYELVYVMSGTLTQHFENSKMQFQQGDACLLNLNVLHREEVETDCEILYLNLLPEFFDEFYRGAMLLKEETLKNSAICRFMKERSEGSAERLDFIGSPALRMEDYFPAAAHLQAIQRELESQSDGYTFRIYSELVALFLELEDPGHYYLSAVHLDAKPEDLLYAHMLRFMEERHGRVSREALSEELNYSPDHLNRITQKRCGMSLLQLEQKYLVDYTCRMLIESDLRVSDIIALTGYKNKNFFYRVFERETGTTPFKYRKMYKKK